MDKSGSGTESVLGKLYGLCVPPGASQGLIPVQRSWCLFTPSKGLQAKTNPLSSQHQALGLYFPYFLGSQCPVLPPKQPLHALLLQSQRHRCLPEVP